jgi:hypothetical protein
MGKLLQMAAAVGKTAALGDIRLLSVEASRSVRNPPTETVYFERKMLEAQWARGSADDGDEDGGADRLVVHVGMALSVRGPEEDGSGQGAALLETAAWFEMTYQVSPDFDDTHIFAFAQINALFNAWPYFREIFDSTIVRMGLPPIALPLFSGPEAEETARQFLEGHEGQADAGSSPAVSTEA